MTWAVFCDFDGTVSVEDSTDLLLERHAPPQWHDLEAQWQRGDIGSAECMRRQVELVSATAGDLDAVAADLTLTAGFADFARLCEELGVPLCIVSDGLDGVIERFFRRHALPPLPVFANHLRPLAADRYTLESPHRGAGCAAGTCKCALMSATQHRLRLFIGDGRSDFCAAAKAADFVIAKDALLSHCRSLRLQHVAFGGFAHAGWVLDRLMRALPGAAPSNFSHSIADPTPT